MHVDQRSQSRNKLFHGRRFGGGGFGFGGFGGLFGGGDDGDNGDNSPSADPFPGLGNGFGIGNGNGNGNGGVNKGPSTPGKGGNNLSSGSNNPPAPAGGGGGGGGGGSSNSGNSGSNNAESQPSHSSSKDKPTTTSTHTSSKAPQTLDSSPTSSSPIIAPATSTESLNTFVPDEPSSTTSGPTTQSDLSTRSQLSKGAAAGIAITLIVIVVVLALIFIRSRNKARRREQTEKSQQWWFNNEKPPGDSRASSRLTAGRQSPEDQLKILSMRSSFGTSFDRGVDAVGPLGDVIPTLPPVLDIGLHSSRNPPMQEYQDMERSSHLAVPVQSKRDSDGSSIGAPMSVRPFSPTESFAFPKPPSISSDRALDSPNPFKKRTPKTSNATAPRRKSETEVSEISNPFSRYSCAAQEGTEGLHEINSAVETIRRPFVPTRDDELRVVPGDVINVVKLFDDGWCFCEVISGQQPGGRGLIPIDCLRETAKALPASLTASSMQNNTTPDTAGYVEGTGQTC